MSRTSSLLVLYNIREEDLVFRPLTDDDLEDKHLDIAAMDNLASMAAVLATRLTDLALPEEIRQLREVEAEALVLAERLKVDTIDKATADARYHSLSQPVLQAWDLWDASRKLRVAE
jgi:hypothetical protein